MDTCESPTGSLDCRVFDHPVDARFDRTLCSSRDLTSYISVTPNATTVHNMSVLSVSRPDEMVDRIVRFADEHGYSGRSEVFREASRTLLRGFKDFSRDGRDLVGVVAVVFD
jgi:hypothetical protein